MTQNFEGKRKRIMGKRKIINYKRASFKRAIVTLDAEKMAIESGDASAGAAGDDPWTKQLPAS